MSAYETRIESLHRRLGIPAGYGERTGLPLQHEPETLVTVVNGPGGRELRLTPGAAARWAGMEAAAEAAGIRLLLVSAFRSPEYQADVIERKLSRGRDLAEVLRVNAAPGYSEHHTGRAVDIATAGQEPLIEEFERSDAFGWLQRNARRWDFALSYPRDNPYGIVYEPWHWAVAAGAD